MTAKPLEPDERACELCNGAGEREGCTCEACWGHGSRAATWYELGCPCGDCGSQGAEERYSLGIYAGRYCPKCWCESGYRDEPASAFDPAYAGETYEEEEL